MQRRADNLKLNTGCNYSYKPFDNSYPWKISLAVLFLFFLIEVLLQKRSSILHNLLSLKIFVTFPLHIISQAP